MKQVSEISFIIDYLCIVQVTKDNLSELEFPQLLEQIVPFAFSPKIAEQITHILPMPLDEAKVSLTKVSEYTSSYENDNAIPFNEYEDIEAELKVMAIENYRLDAASFMKIKNISMMVGKLVVYFKSSTNITLCF